MFLAFLQIWSKGAGCSGGTADEDQDRMAFARGCKAAALLTTISACALGLPSHAQDLGFGLGDGYRHYADPGNGGGSAYTPFFDPYQGNRIVRGAYPDAYYNGHGFHYGKSAPPSLYVDPYSYDPDPRASREPRRR